MKSVVSSGRDAPKNMRSTMDTRIVTPDETMQWRIPPFQRALRVNAKVHEIAEKLGGEGGGCIEGVITLGLLARDKALYVVDGQHRLEAFRLSNLKEGIVDLRIIEFDTMQEMATEFARLNTPIARMTPDDNLRALEYSVEALRMIREACPFVGYGAVRRRDSPGGPIVGMAMVIKAWWGSGRDTPVHNGMAPAGQLGAEMSKLETQQLVTFLTMALAAWGRDPEYWRLWGALNTTLCMWLYRRLVLDQIRGGNKKAVVLSPAQFQGCLTALSADATYLDWLTGRALGDRDRSPCYGRMASVFVRRLMQAKGAQRNQFLMPKPAWASNARTDT